MSLEEQVEQLKEKVGALYDQLASMSREIVNLKLLQDGQSNS